MLSSCGIEESKEKACPLSTKMVFIGVMFDTEDLTLSVIPEKLQEILELVESWLQKQSATLQGLQSLVGKLSFVLILRSSKQIFYFTLYHL